MVWCKLSTFSFVSRRFLTFQSQCRNVPLLKNGYPCLQTAPIQCRFHHFQQNGNRLFHVYKTRTQQLPWFHRQFRTRRKLKEEDSIVQRQTQNDSHSRGLLKPVLFTLAVCGVSFTGAIIWQYEVMRHHAQRLIHGEKGKSLRYGDKNYGFRTHINQIWNNLSQGQKLVVGVVLANFGVFILWKVPTLKPFMARYFTNLPGAPSVTMLTAAFSHYSFIHLFCNMYVLWSFSGVALSLFGKEQLSAVFLSAAAFSSLTGMMNKTLRGRMVPSLGASGALMAVLGAVCVSYPNAKLSIAFIGNIIPHSFSAHSALLGIVAFDTVGLLLGWRMLDHAAHLGGVLFGIWYTKYGRDLIWNNREPVMKFWHDVRGKP